MQLSDKELKEEIVALIGEIKDPQKHYQTLESLHIINENSVSIVQLPSNHKNTIKDAVHQKKIMIELTPTNPNCHLVQQIGLSIRYKLSLELLHYQNYKIYIKCKEGTHSKANDVQKQINDKERILAALENLQIIKYLEKLVN